MTVSVGTILAITLLAFGLMLSIGHIGQHGIFAGSTGIVASAIIAVLLATLAERIVRRFRPPLQH